MRQLAFEKDIEQSAEAVVRRQRSGLLQLRERFLLFTDGLFGSTDEKNPVTRRDYLIYAGLVPVLMLLQILRKPDTVTNPQFFAESGSIFFKDSLLQGFWQPIFSSYSGFPYLLHRLVAGSVLPFGIEAAPLAYGLASIFIVALASAFFSLPHFRHILHNDYLRIGVCLLIIVLPGSEVLVGVLANIHWYLGIWALLASLMRLPSSRWGLVLLYTAYFLTIFSTPIAIIIGPLWVQRILRAVLRRNFRELILGIFVCLCLFTVLRMTGNLGAQSDGSFSLKALFNLIVTRVIGQAILGSEVQKQLNVVQNLGVFYLVSAVFLVGLLALSKLIRFRSAGILLVCLYNIVISVLILLLGRASFGWSQIWSAVGNGKEPDLAFIVVDGSGWYFFQSIFLIYLALFVTLEQLPANRFKRFSLIVYLVALVLITAQSFALPAYPDFNWKDAAVRITAKLQTRSPGPLSVLIPPTPQLPWDITLDLDKTSSSCDKC